MSTPELTFNLLNFIHPSERLTFRFTADAIEGLHRLHRSIVPQEVVVHLGERCHYYTSFDGALEGGLEIDKATAPGYVRMADDPGERHRQKAMDGYWGSGLLKRYYNFVIHRWFTGHGYMVKPNFIDDTEIWVASERQMHDRHYRYFDKFTLKVQLARVTSMPELLLSYEGCSKVFRCGLDDLQQRVAPEYINWVVYRDRLWRLGQLPDEGRRAYREVFPVWNFGIRSALGQPAEAPERGNRYLKYRERINWFYARHLMDNGFREVIPLDGKGFVRVDPIRIGEVSRGCNRLLFGTRHGSIGRDISPVNGLKEHGPFELSPFPRTHLFFIMHRDDVEKAKHIIRFFQGDIPGFKGLQRYVHINYHVEPNFSIQFQNRENPLPEVAAQLSNKRLKDEVSYIAVYLSPISKFDGNEQRKIIYYRLKELLLKYHVVSQVLDVEKIMNPKVQYHYSLPNIAIAMLSKLNGTPWRLDTKLKNELVVGVGAFRHVSSNVQYIGSAFSFQNNGKFDRFECFRKNEVKELAGSILSAVKQYVLYNQQINKLVIHFYKPINHDELQPIEEGLHHLGLSIPVYIITINKTESNDIVAFDNHYKQAIPLSGTYINMGQNHYLLFNNTRYDDAPLHEHSGFHFPVKLSISCNDSEKTKDIGTIRELLEQVYQFSRVYWKSLSQQNLPVTIKYPEMVAGMFPYFDGSVIPEFGKSNLWFL